MTAKSKERLLAEDIVRTVWDQAAVCRWPVAIIRRELVARWRTLAKRKRYVPRHTWYRAVVAVTGTTVTRLRDRRQLSLFKGVA